jgi:hypothetical protein
MGLFNKAKQAAQQAQTFAQRGQGAVHVRGAGPIDPAIMGGPSTRAVAGEDPIWQPINGVSLQDYADIAREAQARGINDEAGMITLAQERGWNPPDTQGRAGRLGTADGPVDGRRAAVPHVPRLLTELITNAEPFGNRGECATS